MKRVYKLAFLAAALIGVATFLRASLPLVLSGTWAAVAPMSSARAGASAVLLQDGRILITGGDAGSGALATADLFNTDGTISPAPPMNDARSHHASVTLQDGRVLVIGGVTSGGGATNSAEVYDPIANSWTHVGVMTEARSGATATPLKDGRVLIAGGQGVAVTSSTLEVFDPAAGAFNFAGALSSPRQNHAAAVLADGRVLIIGGSNGSAPVASVDVYDPAAGSISVAASLNTPRQGHSATTMLDGRVLVAGGSTTGNNGLVDLASAEIYDPSANTFTATTANLATARQGHLAFLLPHNNSVLITGGTSNGTPIASAELFIPWGGSNQSGIFQATGLMGAARSNAAGSALGMDGLLLVAGGKDATGNALASAELYGFATVKTDASDYPPGTTVNITGSGWQPGETVTLTLVESPLIDTHGPFTAVADANGNLSNSSFVTDLHDVNIRFSLTATGSVSQAQTTFTDSKPNKISAVGAQFPNPVPAGTSATYSVTVSFNGNISSCNAVLSTSGLPGGASAVFAPVPATNPANTITSTGADVTTTLTMFTTAGMTPGTTTFTITATGVSSPACNSNTASTGSGGSVANPTLIVSEANQTITFSAPPNKTYGNSDFGLSASASSGLTVSFTSTTTGVCTVSGTTVHLVATGTCTIRASQAGNSNYNPAPNVDQSFTVNPAILTYVADAKSRSYGAANPAFTGTVTGFVAGDTQASATTGTLTFATPATIGSNAGNYAINGSGLTANNGNYTFVQAASNTTALTINPVTLTASIINNPTKPYDGNATATLAATNFSLSGLVGTESITVTQTAGSYNSANVLTATTVTASLSGANFTAGSGTLLTNYVLPTTASGAGHITAVTLTGSIINNPTKPYDSNATATLAATNFSLSGLVGTESITVTQTAGTYNSANVATATTVTASLSGTNFTAGSGTLLTNYVLPTTASGPGHITAVTLTASIINNPAKPYDGTTSATLASANFSLTPLVGSESFTVTQTSGTYNFKDVATATTVTASLSAGQFTPINGAIASNYVLPTTASGPGHITAVTLTASIIGNPAKPYDGTTSATLASANFSLTPLVGSESFTVTQTSGTYNFKDVATATTVTASLSAGQFTPINGAIASNYVLPTTASGTGHITAVTLTASIINNPAKPYDGNATATLAATNFSLSGLVGTESITVTQTAGTYNSPNVATATTVTASLTSGNFTAGSGTLLTNYVLPTTASGAGHITAVTLTASIINNPAKPYDGNATATLAATNFSLSGLVGTESITVTQTAGTYNSANVLTATTVTASLSGTNFTAGSGTLLTNYVLPTTASGAGHITAVTLTASIINNPAKPYDGNATATLAATNFSLSGLVGTESITVTQTAGSYNSANVLTATTVTTSLSGTNFTAGSGTLLTNYVLPTTGSGAGHITAVTLTASIINNPAKPYDGNATATLAATNFSLSGLVGTESITVTQTAGTYDSPNVATATTVTASLTSGNFTAGSGTLLTNYVLPTTASGTGHITAVTLTASIINNPAKPYDGNATATLAATNFSLSGLVGTESITVTQTAGTYNSANVATATAVTASLTSGNFTAGSGTLLTNYVLPTTASGAGHITAVTLTASIINNPAKPYDGNATATLAATNFSLSGLVGTESITVTQTAGTYDSPNVATATTVTASLSGTNFTAGNGTLLTNYVLPTTASGTGHITAVTLTASIINNPAKPYDGNATATLAATNFSLSGLVGTESITVTQTAGTYDSPNVATATTVTASLTSGNFTAGSGTLLTNYVLPTTASGAGHITAVTLTASIINNPAKPYDGNATATLAATNFSLSGLVGTESITVTQTAGIYNSPNVAAATTVTATLAGTDFTAGTGTLLTNYVLPTSASGAGHITPLTVTVTPNAGQFKIYGSADPALTYGFTPALVVGDSFSGMLARDPGANVGLYNITQGTLALSTNYTLTFTTGVQFEIKKLTVTVTPDAGQFKIYGSADPALTYGFTPALVVGDSFSGMLARDPGANVGLYNITQGTLALSTNYTLTFTTGVQFEIKKLTVTVTPNAGQFKIYGSADPALTYGFTPALVVGDSFSGMLARDPGANVGLYNITQGTLALSTNYTLTFTTGVQFEIKKLTVTVTPNAGQFKIYGSADPALTYGFTPALVVGDSFSGMLARDPGANVGLYNITQGTLALSTNYTLTFTTGVQFEIKKLTVTVTPNAGQFKIYGSADPALTYGFTPALVVGDSFSGMLARDPGANVGLYNITQGTLALSTNYTLTFTTGVQFEIKKLTVTVTPDAGQFKIYGSADPALTYGFTPALVVGDSFSGMLARDPGANVGLYNITQGTLALSTNYTLTFTTGVQFEIKKLTVTVTPDASQFKIYGSADPALTYGFTPALVVGDSFSGMLARDPGANVGLYNITQGTLALSTNYTLTFTTGVQFEIKKLTVTVTPNAGQFKIYGSADPALTYGFTPALVVGDSFSGMLARDPGANVGLYNITQGTLALSTNYTLTFTAGVQFEIKKLTVTVTPDAGQFKIYSSADPGLTYGFTPALVVGDSFSGMLARDPGANVGLYNITQGTLALSTNYTLTFTTGVQFEIKKLTVTVTPDASQFKIYGSADPALTYGFTPALVVGDSFSGMLARDPGANVGLYNITQGTLALSTNYTLTFTAGVQFEIKKLTVTVTPDAGQFKIYGSADPALTYGFTPALVVGDSFSGTLARDPGANVGLYNITQGTLALSTNYTLTFTTGVQFEIKKLTVTVTPDAGQFKIYSSADPALTYGFTPALVVGDSFSGMLARDPGANVGLYNITQGTLALSTNYTLTFTAGVQFEIKKLTVTVTPDAGQFKIYSSADPGLTYGFTPALVVGDSFSGMLARDPGANVGLYNITQGTLALSTNYTLTFTTGVQFEIKKLTVTVTPDASQFKIYGSADPALTYGFTPALVVGDSFSGMLARDPGANVGLYNITQGTLALSTNYTLTFTTGVQFEIKKALLTVTADNKAMILHAGVPPLTASYSGFKFTDTLATSVTGSPSLTTPATSASPTGPYPIVAALGTLAASNYNFGFVNGTLTVQYASGGICDGDAGHQILQPINADGSSVFNGKSTSPAKFRVCDASGVSIGTPGVVSNFYIYQVVAGTVVNTVDEIVYSTTPDLAFRWDPTAQQWIFNINNKSYPSNRTYFFRISLNDGTVINFNYGLK